MLVFFKRYRMQFDLRGVSFEDSELSPPPEFELLPWQPSLLSAHARAKFLSFQHELDANVFSCLGNADGCNKLMQEITRRKGFVPEATWLLSHHDPITDRVEYVGTVQGICENPAIGLIQNVGIVDRHRGHGLGSMIVRNALAGFQRVGARLVTLEVTVNNDGAIRLYQRLGFSIQKTVYKSVDVPSEG